MNRSSPPCFGVGDFLLTKYIKKSQSRLAQCLNK
nr:MAG TPA: hypothetical protein [Caudoviricetes sp.]